MSNLYILPMVSEEDVSLFSYLNFHLYIQYFGFTQNQFLNCCFDQLCLQGEKEEEEEEVTLINSIINPAFSNAPYLVDDNILPEFEDLLSGEIDFPLPDKSNKAKKDKVYETEMANNANELKRLHKLVKELEEREIKLEGELLEYYGLKEQESDILELQRQLQIKTVKIDMLNITINSLQAERKRLQEEISAKKELNVA